MNSNLSSTRSLELGNRAAIERVEHTAPF